MNMDPNSFIQVLSVGWVEFAKPIGVNLRKYESDNTPGR